MLCITVRGVSKPEIYTIGKIPVALRAGMRVCQITLMETGPVARPYGPLRGSTYQGQREPTPSRLRKDVEFRARMESLMR